MDDLDYIVGKILLIGITFLDADEKLIEQIQVYGPVLRVDPNGIVICRNGTHREFTIPADIHNLSTAKSGEYRLRSTGEIVADPDYLSSWTVRIASKNDIQHYSECGFSGWGTEP